MTVPGDSGFPAPPLARLRSDHGTVSFFLQRDVPALRSRADHARAVLRWLPGWLRDPALRPTLLRVFEALRGPLRVTRSRVVLDVVPALSRAIEDGRVVVIVEETALPPPVMVMPADSPKPGVPATPEQEASWFQVRFVDEVGAPIGALGMAFAILGSARKATTGADGVTRLEGETVSTAGVTVPDVGALRELLRPRWSQPRQPQIPSGPHVFVRELGATFEPVTIDAEVPATIVIKPHFRCAEVPGAHFEFGRSFPRGEALAALAPIAQDLHGEPICRAMIFGHSDKMGSDALNKELSERRARAVYALFTHDAPAWEELFTNAWSGGHWSELWGTREVQHMLSALHVPTADGAPLVENGILDARTVSAIKAFQRGQYPDKPAEQAPLADDGIAGPLTRKELFLAYAKRISRKPVPPDRLARVGAEPYMGCGEYNPLSLSAKDAESRRVVLLLFDIAAEPQGLPCKLRSLGPCKANVGPEPKEADPGGKPPYRCKVYQDVASRCPCQGGADVSHDLILQVPRTLAEVNTMPHVFVLESEDGTVQQTRTLAGDARATELGFVEISYHDLPPMHRYRLRCEGVQEPYLVFDFTAYDQLGSLAARSAQVSAPGFPTAGWSIP